MSAAFQKGWLAKTLSGRTVEHVPCPMPGGLVDKHAPPAGVVHTIEGSLSAGLGVFHEHYAPHFTLDGDRIVQLVPLGYMAAALENRLGGVETNSVCRAQIEVAGYSKTTLWLPDGPTAANLADLLATLEHVARIPLTRPFPDEMPAQPWATTSFPRRHAGKWGKTAGWYGHVDVPENEHWDPGALAWSVVLAKAKAIVAAHEPHPAPHPKPAAAPRPLPAWYWTWLQWRLAEGAYADGKPADDRTRPQDAPARIPGWAWAKAAGFVAARRKAA